MNKKLMAVAAAAVSAVMALSSCGFVPSPDKDGIMSKAEKNSYDETIVAEVNGQEMTLADFNFMYYNNAAQIQQYYLYMGISDWENQEYVGDDDEYIGRTYGDIVRSVTIDQMSQFIVAQQKAKEYDILIDDDIMKAANEEKKSLIESSFGGDEEEYKNYLDYCFISDYTVEKYLQRSQVIYNLIDRLSQEGEICYVSEDDVRNSFIKASHVLITIDDDTTDEEAYAKALEVIARLDNGDDMADLIAEYGEDPGMKQQDYYVFTEGEMVEPFYEGAKALDPDEYSKEPVKTSYGYHVIYRYPLTNADEGYEDVATRTSEVRNNLINTKFSEAMMQWVDTASTKVYDDVLDEALAAQAEELAKEQEEALATAQAQMQNQIQSVEPTDIDDGALDDELVVIDDSDDAVDLDK